MVAKTNRIRKNSGNLMTKAIDIANWFITKANSEKVEDSVSEGITNLKLQKILYFAQAAHLALFNKKELFEDEIIAWQYGPVIENIYHTFKPKASSKTKSSLPIPEPTNENYLNLPADTVKFLENTWNIFGKFSAMKLVQMSHSHQPWKNAHKAGESAIISKDSIYDYYRNIFRTV